MRITSFLLVLALAACSGQPVSDDVTMNGGRAVDGSNNQKVDVVVALAVAGITNTIQSFFVKKQEEKVLVTEKSSRIHIPKNAFRRKDGKAISGDVKVTFSEYQTSGEIIASGLPMTYTGPDGKTINFESAGMFEIRAYDGKDTLELAPGKDVKVELASSASGSYNFYTLNDESGKWKELATNQQPVPGAETPKMAEKPSAVAAPKVAIKRKLTSKPFDLRANPDKYHDFRELNGVMWQYAGKNPQEDPSVNPSSFNKKYAFVRMTPVPGDSLVFNMEFTSSKGPLTLEMAPVFTPALEKRYTARQAEKAAEQAKAERLMRESRDQSEKETAMLRAFDLDHLGVYNYDRQLKEPNAISILPSFKFGNKDHKDHENVSVYLIPAGKEAAIRYDMHTIDLFRIDPSIDNTLLAIVGKDVYMLTPKEIKEMKLQDYKGEHKTIELKRVKRKINSGKELDELISSR